MSDDYYYYDKKKRPLSLVPDACLVSLREPFRGRPREYFPELKQRAKSLADELGLEVDPGYFPRYIVLRGNPERLQNLHEHPAVRCLRNLYKDQDGLEFALSDEVMVKFEAHVPIETREAIIREVGCRPPPDAKGKKESYWLITVESPAPDAPLWVANRLFEEKRKYVRYAVPNAVQPATLAQAPGRPEQAVRFGEQWHLQILNAEAVWANTCGHPDVVVAVIDSGVDLKHREFAGQLKYGYDFASDDNKPMSLEPHGTYCTGAIVARGRQVAGIAPGCKVMPLRAKTWNDHVEALEYCSRLARKGRSYPDVICCSWHGTANEPMEEAITQLAQRGRDCKGIPIFCASGNEGKGRLPFPANLSQKNLTITVGASTDRDVRWGASNYGNGLDFLAPGWSKENGGVLTTNVNNDYRYVPGTSLATPLAAGVAALMLSVNPRLKAQEVREIMQKTAEKINPHRVRYDARGWNERYGYGRIDAYKAVMAAKLI